MTAHSSPVSPGNNIKADDLANIELDITQYHDHSGGDKGNVLSPLSISSGAVSLSSFVAYERTDFLPAMVYTQNGTVCMGGTLSTSFLWPYIQLGTAVGTAALRVVAYAIWSPPSYATTGSAFAIIRWGTATETNKAVSLCGTVYSQLANTSATPDVLTFTGGGGTVGSAAANEVVLYGTCNLGALSTSRVYFLSYTRNPGAYSDTYPRTPNFLGFLIRYGVK